MSDHDQSPEADDPPDAGISLSIRLPLVLGPDERNPDGLVLMAWATDTGETLFQRKLSMDELSDDTAMAMVEKLDRPVHNILLIAYDGNDGEIMTTQILHTQLAAGGLLVAAAEDGTGPMPAALKVALAETTADPDELCVLCDDSLPNGAEYDRTLVHPECLLANLIGPLGHHLDHDFWCINMADPFCGLGARLAGIDLMALVERYGLKAVVSGDFPKDEVPTAGRTGDA